ncbi:MAG: cellulase family glycosylhydrolase [Limisphaerales bacterium]
MTNSLRSIVLLLVAIGLAGVLHAQTLTDIGTAAPTPGANDISQLSTQGNQTAPDSLNYYTDNQTGLGTGEPGQTFTTGTNPGGYLVTSVTLRTGGIGGNSGIGTAQPYYLHIYSISGSTATLLQTYTSGNITFNDGDWLKWTGLSVPLSANAAYAYSFGKASTTSGWEPMAVASGNPKSGGEIALISPTTGTITTGSSHNFDAVFDLGLVLSTTPGISAVTISPAANVRAGIQMAFTASVAGATPLYYQWQFNSGSGFVNLSGANTNTLSFVAAVTNTGSYQLVLTNSYGAVTSAPVALAVAPAFTNIPASMPWPNPTYGMNVGNELELNWGPPNAALFYSAAFAGFNAVRIPCAWDMSGATTNVSGGVTNYVISPSYMAQVKQTVDAAISQGMYVMINDHWDDGWLQSNIGTNVDPIVNAKVNAYWTQIATTFAGYDNHLLFAACNEPNVNNPTEMVTLMFYYQTFVNAIRAAGGNNTNRWLVLQGGGDTTWLNSLPTDTVSNRLMVEYHNYTPFQFTQLQGDASWGAMQYYWGPAYHYPGDPSHDCGTPEEGAMDAGFQQLVDQYVSKGIPVMIGEFQAAGKSVLSTNATEQAWNSLSCYYWNKYLVDSANARGMSPFYWSTGNSPFDYGTGAVYDTNAVRVLTGGVAFPPPNGAPYAASGLIAMLSNNTNVNLSWTAGSGATSYNLYRAAESGGEPTNPVVTGITGTTYTDTNLNSGTTYYYQVVAVNGSGPTGYSPEAHATTTGVNPDPAQFNFETDSQGWAGGGGIISGVATSTAQHYAGKQSLAVNINSTNANSSAVNLGNVSVLPGQTITFHVWIPSGSKITSLQPYIQDNNWTWTWGDYNGSLTGNAWNTVTVTVPANAVSPFHYLNLQFNASAAWTGTCYIDSVSWNAPAPDFSLSRNPSSLTVQGGTSGTSTVTVTALYGLNACYTLSASNLPSGVFATFANNPSTGGASLLTLTASNTVTSGTTNVTVIATAGLISHTTTVALTLNPFTPPAATNFTWSVPTPITTADATLSPPSGSVLVGAAAFGGTAYTVTLTNGTQINFTANGSVATATGNGTATGSFSGNTSNANFNAVLNEFNYDGGPKTITLNNLTAGSRYIVMFFGLDDRSPENLRQAYLQDPNLSGDVSQTWQMGSNVCVMGAFTATSSTKTLFEQLPGNSSGGDVTMGNANALVLWMVASPSNTPPVLAPIANQTVNVGQTVAFTASATDTDQPPQTLTFALLSGTTNATLNTSSGAFSFRPLVTQANSTNNFTLKVSDNGTPPLSATQSFSVVVNPLSLPALTSVSFSNMQFSMHVSGQAGPDYEIQTSTNLMQWSNVFITNSPGVPFVWRDTNSAVPQRFYRVKLGPPLP